VLRARHDAVLIRAHPAARLWTWPFSFPSVPAHASWEGSQIPRDALAQLNLAGHCWRWAGVKSHGIGV